MGISGRIASRFLKNEITPLLALIGLLLGVFAIVVTPREEEPQINVTFANVFIPFPGASVAEVERLVTNPAEQVLSEVEGIKHVYSVSVPGMATLTIRFKVGEDNTDAIVRLYNKVFSNSDWFPSALGVGQPIIKPMGIDDVPVVNITLWSRNESVGAYELSQVSHSLEAELKRVAGTRGIYTVGAPEQVVHVFLDAQRLAGFNISINDLRESLSNSNTSIEGGSIVAESTSVPVRAGTFLVNAEQIGQLVVGVNEGNPVFLEDVARIVHSPYHPEAYVQHAFRGVDGSRERHPAVTLAIAKKPGVNAVDLAAQLIDQVAKLEGVIIPDAVEYTITRNYGETADHKAKKLIQKLLFATLSVVLLVLIAMSWRESLIVGTAVIITLSATLFASWAVGFTINRVSLFALIFSIGILVDDAIVVVENIHRYLHRGGQSLLEKIPRAVDEVGGPTILATLTVIAALLPMAFVSGLMGPYMSPIPINASMGMLISLLVAFVVTPWMSFKLLGRSNVTNHHDDGEILENDSRIYRLFDKLFRPFIHPHNGRRNRFLASLVILMMIAGSLWLVINTSVVMKMLPFDDKSELQIVVDLREGTTVEQTARVLDEIGEILLTMPEVSDYQSYAGTSSPIGFNGLVRQYYLRELPHQGDIQVTLVPAAERDGQSHDVALAIRNRIAHLNDRFDANIRIAEVPPGPPVFSPILAEVYGFDYQTRVDTAMKVQDVFEHTDDIVDIDNSLEYPSPRIIIEVDRSRAALLGVSQKDVAETVRTLIGGEDVSYLRDTQLKYAVPIRLEFSVADKADVQNLLSFKIRAQSGRLVPLSEIVSVRYSAREASIYHKDLLPVVYVMGDMAGKLDSPLYGMFEMVSKIRDLSDGAGNPLTQSFTGTPDSPYQTSIKWDGEWQITYETFRDMGIAYLVGIILIYLLVVAQFKSYVTPLIIMAPILLTIIGVMPGHALLGAKFTATSMIGMIALAGIIVRNSILLVDFIQEQVKAGTPLDRAVILSGAVRSRPIILTGLAAMMGAFFILDDPIFNGLAVTLIFGIIVSTLLTLFVIPLLYFGWRSRRTRASDSA
ncbi:MAG: multidrug transporter AcrB [marine bacterium B5-7]|nr:MAG: multidrug transporter AcrB [marine bacterium B5-7]